MKDKIKAHIFSAGITFVSSFLLILGTSFSGLTNTNLTGTIIVSLIVAAARAAGKAVFEDVLKTDVLLGVK